MIVYIIQLTLIVCAINIPFSRARNEEFAYVQCEENLLEATSGQKGILDKQGYVDFIRLQSIGAISAETFDSLDLALLHTYWDIICTIESECATSEYEVEINDLFDFTQGDGHNLSNELCDRVNAYLYENNILTLRPTMSPTIFPSAMFSPSPSKQPTVNPTTDRALRPSRVPSKVPTKIPSITPSSQQTMTPSVFPSPVPSKRFTDDPTVSPSLWPTSLPTSLPTIDLSNLPTMLPKRELTSTPSVRFSDVPSLSLSTTYPTMVPSSIPSNQPTVMLSRIPTKNPSYIHSISPTKSSETPTQQPSASRSIAPTQMPSAVLPPVFSFSVIFSIQYRDDNISSDQLEADLSDCVNTFIVGEINDRFKLMCDVMRNDCPYIVQVASSLYKFNCFDDAVENDVVCALIDINTTISQSSADFEIETVSLSDIPDALKEYIDSGRLTKCVNE